MPRNGDTNPDVLGPFARRDLRDARDEHAWQLSRWRTHRHLCCETDVEEDLRADLAAAKAELLRIVWACCARQAGLREIAEVLDVDQRTVERYIAEFRTGLGGNGRVGQPGVG